ncbi:hypothetical protein [Streptomyces sp. NPDC002082]|uniref:hypothetical protein n=1 Tax=Streptomyces sp. NPDC002082 TaxID=3154772 RepID=UPI003318510B
MASNQLGWWHQATDASTSDALALESAAGQQERFAGLDALTARLLAAALNGQAVATVIQRNGTQVSDAIEVVGLTPEERTLCTAAFGVHAQQQRGAWYLPQKLSLKAGAVNLPHLIRQRPFHALTMAADDNIHIGAVENADTVLLWALLIPLFDTLMEPVPVSALQARSVRPRNNVSCGPG